MSGRHASSSRRWALLALLGIAACNAIAGIDDPVVVKPQGESCILNSDCDDLTQVCLFKTCSPPCEKDVDCDAGEYCLSTEAGNGCVTTGRASCGDGEACPSGSACFDGECRTDCRSDASICLADQRCEADGACRGSGGGGTGGTSGTGGSAGTSTGGGGPGGEGGGGDGGSGGSVTPGDPCPDEGAFKCTGHASPGRLVCENGVWATGSPCGNGELCDSESDPTGECAVVPDECRGRTPGTPFCDGLTRVMCGADLVTVERMDCDTIQHCTLATDLDCAACLPNQHECRGDVLGVCNDAHTGFDEVETCTDEPCNAEAGACTTLACLTVGARRCVGDRLEECNANRDGFDLVMACDPGLCDPVNLECDVCIPGEVICVGGNTQRECDADGQDHTDTRCPSGTPVCTGAGQCVECTQVTDCTPPTPCYTRACNAGNGQCQYDRFQTHQACSGGYCTAAGECVECTQAAGQCQASGACYVAICDGTNHCDEDPRGTMETCSTGYCNGAGACVQCNVPTQCQTTGPCYDPTCSTTAHTCGQTPKNARVSCTGGICDGSGACVGCLVSTDCTQPSGECVQATCSGQQMCVTGPKNPGTMCSGGGNTWVCDGAGTCVDCIDDTQCGAPTTLCRSRACVDPIHSVGWESITTGSQSAALNTLYFMRLPRLSFPARVTAFGVNGTGSTSADMALYLGNASTPTGGRLTQTNGIINVTNGPREVNANPAGIPLNTTDYYWLAIVVSPATSLKSVANGAAVGVRVPGFAFGSAFPANPAGSTNNGIDYAIWIKVTDTQ